MSKISLDKAKSTKNDEYYTRHEDVVRLFEEFNFYDNFNFSNYVVGCPFDTEDSPFIKEFKSFDRGIEILHSHINAGGDFFKIYDLVKQKVKRMNKKLLLVSNPPFSKLREILEFINDDVIKQDLDFIFITPMTFFTTKIGSVNCNKGFINNLNIRKFDTSDGVKEVQSYILTSLKNYEEIYTDEIKEIDEGFTGRFGHSDIQVYNTYKFKDNGYNLLAVPVSYLFNQRRGYLVLGLCPRIKKDGKELFARILITKEETWQEIEAASE